MHVTFVCTGNICRSPSAHLIFERFARAAGIEVEVTSAGTGGWHVGDQPDDRARRALERRGYPTDHLAEQLNDTHLGADLIVAMDSGHVRALKHLGVDPGKIRLLRSFDPAASSGAEVADPYYGDAEGFETMLDQLEAAMPGLIDYVS